MSMDSAEINYGCLFCRTGQEARIAAEIMKREPEVRAIVPEKLRIRRLGKEAVEERVVLFPGYVFFATRFGIDEYSLKNKEDVYKLLTPSERDWRLQGADRRFAEIFFECNGLIGFSQAYFENGRIRIKEGFMKGYEGQIVKVNQRAKTAMIRMDFQGKVLNVWMGYELIEEVQ